MAFDSLGRQIEFNEKTASSMLGPVGPKKEFKPGEDKSEAKASQRIVTALGDLKATIQSMMDQVKVFADQVIGQHLNLREVKSGNMLPPKERPTFKNLGDPKIMKPLFERQNESFADNFDLLDKLARAGLKKGSIYMNDTHAFGQRKLIHNQNSVMIQLLLRIAKAMDEEVAARTGRPVVPQETIVESQDNGALTARRLNDEQLLSNIREDTQNDRVVNNIRMRGETFGRDDLLRQIWIWQRGYAIDAMTALNQDLSRFSAGLMKQGEEPSPMEKGLFGGSRAIFSDLGKTNAYQKNIAEIAYATEGITVEMQKQQGMFRANADTTNVAIASGQDKVRIEDQYLKLLKFGYKTQKDTLRVTKVGAHLATSIGAGFEESSEFANELHMSLGLSVDSVGEIARGMKATARSSKLSGTALIQAANAAKPVLDALHNTGTLTAVAAKNIISMQASLQKFGVGSNFQELMNAISSPSNVMNADFETQTMLAIMGGNESLMRAMNGSLANDPKKMMQGWQNLSDFVGQLTGKTLSGMAKMGEDELAQFLNSHPEIDLRIKGTFKKGIGELVKGMQAAQEAAKGFDDRMREIDVKVKDVATTDEERVKLLQQQQDLIQTQRSDIIARAAKAFEGSSTTTEAANKLRGNQNTVRAFQESANAGLFGKDFRASEMNTDAGLMEALSKTMKDSIKRSNEILAKNPDRMDDRFIVKNAEGQIDRALRMGNTKELQRLNKQILEAEEAASASTMADTDPARAAAKGINSLNALFKEKMDDALMYLKLIAGANIIKGAGLATLATSLLSPFYSRTVGWLMKEADNRGGMANWQVALEKFENVFGGGKLKSWVTGAAEGVAEGLHLNKVAEAVKSVGGLAGRGIGKAANAGGMANNLLKAQGIDLGGIIRTVATWVGEDVKKVALKTGEFIMSHGGNKAAAMGRGALDIAGKVLNNPRQGIGEGIFRFAKAQEELPIWGRFAKLFGAGNEAKKQTVQYLMSSSRVGTLGKSAVMGAGGTGAELLAEGGAMASGGALAKVASKAFLPLAVLLGVLEGTDKALKTGARAAEIFQVSTDKVSNSQRAAAENAGFLLGIMDALSFGLFGLATDLFGWTEGIENSLSKMIAGFQPLNIVMSVIVTISKAVYGVFWGIVEGLWEIIKGVGRGFMSILEPFGDVLNIIFDTISEVSAAFSDMVSPLASVFGEFKGGIPWVELIIGSLRLFGKTLGTLIHGIMYGISIPLRVLAIGIKAVSLVIIGLAKVISTVLKPGFVVLGVVVGTLVDAVNILTAVMIGFFKVIKALPGNIVSAIAAVPGIILRGILGIGPAIVNAFTGIGNMVYNAVTGIFSGLGNLVRNIPLIGRLMPAQAPNPAPQVPGLAAGGVVKTPGLIYAGEKEPELVIPMTQFQEAVANVQYGLDGIHQFSRFGNPLSIVDEYIQTAQAVQGGEGIATVNAKPLTSVDTRVHHDHASSGPMVAEVASPELTTIANLTSQQNALLMQAVSTLEEIKKGMVGSSSLSGFSNAKRGDARSHKKELSSPNYYTMSFGGYGGNASKGYIQDGVT